MPAASPASLPSPPPSNDGSVAPAAPPAPRPPSPTRRLGAVAAESQAAADVGARILDRGGNAIDAAVAMAFVSAVTQPSSCGLGGGGFATAWDPSTPSGAVIDFRETAPGGLRLRDHLGASPPWERRGVLVGVPGFVAGLTALHGLGGALPWAAVVEDARRLADEGFVVEPWLATTIGWSERALRREPGASFLFTDGGGVPRVGDRLRNAALARTLAGIAAGEGLSTDHVVTAARAVGSTIVAADLERYAAIRRPPIRVPFGGHEVLLPPPPSAGGIAVAQQLLAFPAADVVALEPADAVHLGAEGLRAATAERRQWIGDPAFTRMDLAWLLDPSRLAAVRAALPPSSVTPPSGAPIEDGGTCHVVAWDGGDRVVSLTTSVGSMFGAKIATAGGFFLGDALADFAHDAHARRAITRGPNVPRAGARPTSSMAPAIVVRGGAPVLALGASGGARIPASLVQVLQRVLARGEALERAIDAPRWYAPSGGGLHLEEGLAPLADALRARGEAIDGTRPSYSAVTAVAATRDDDGGVVSHAAAVDPRKGGGALVVTAAD